MSIFLPLYFRMSKKRFQQPFKPLGTTKKAWHLVSAPGDTANFFKATPFLYGLSKIANVVVLMPKTLEPLRSFMKTKQFEIIIYEKRPSLFSEDFKRVSLQLGERHFHFLIELNDPANISLPYLSNFQRRVAFYDSNNYPYYNILVKNGYASLGEFFSIEAENAKNIFHFQSRELKAFEKHLGKSRPLLFVNGGATIDWKGDRIVLGEDVMPEDPDVWKALYITDAYFGKKDAFHEFALLNNKTMLT